MEGRRFGRNDPCPCGSGQKYKRCCLASGRFQHSAMPTPRGVYGEGASLLTPPPRQAPPRRHPPRPLPAVTRVPVDYTFPEPFGHAEVSYSFEAGLLVPLEGGYVVPVERLQPGMQFMLDNGAVGTVTDVGQPKVCEPPPAEPDADGNYARRVLGRIKHTGFMVLDLSFAGLTVTTTPGHLFYSLDRRGWVGAEVLHVGEALLNDLGERLRLDGRSRIRHGFVELYNVEVEQFHTYLVGRDPGGSVLAHNGVPGPGGPGYIPKPMSVAERRAAAEKAAKVDMAHEDALLGQRDRSFYHRDAKESTLQPGPYAGESIPARGPGRSWTNQEVRDMDRVMADTGCHTCGAKKSGTPDGHAIPDHQPPSQLNFGNEPQQLFPHCLSCSLQQGGQVRRFLAKHAGGN